MGRTLIRQLPERSTCGRDERDTGELRGEAGRC